jgi:hypothetical protein
MGMGRGGPMGMMMGAPGMPGMMGLCRVVACTPPLSQLSPLAAVVLLDLPRGPAVCENAQCMGVVLYPCPVSIARFAYNV